MPSLLGHTSSCSKVLFSSSHNIIEMGDWETRALRRDIAAQEY